MRAREINFDGLVGPTHNYAGLSLGNLASASHAGAISRPRDAALQGLAKMRALVELGVGQGVLLPHARPHLPTLHRLGFRGSPEAMCAAAFAQNPRLFANVCSASAMWTANAATVSPSADTEDGRVHFTPANLAAMLHRSVEPEFTARQLRTIFNDPQHFMVHDPLPGGVHLGDEGAANHLRLAPAHWEPGVEIFVHGGSAGGLAFPARQREAASRAVARLHGLRADRTLFLSQSARAIGAGVFHNDVISVGNERLLLVHAAAFEDQALALRSIRELLPSVAIIEVSERDVPIADAVGSYLFNSQLISPPDHASGMTLVLPGEAQRTPSVVAYLARLAETDRAIGRTIFVDLRESMRNGGGPACLRLRVVLRDDELDRVDQRFLLSFDKIDRLSTIVAARYPEEIEQATLGDPALHRQCFDALDALASELGCRDIYDFQK